MKLRQERAPPLTFLYNIFFFTDMAPFFFHGKVNQAFQPDHSHYLIICISYMVDFDAYTKESKGHRLLSLF
jgi:hypothetical protein